MNIDASYNCRVRKGRYGDNIFRLGSSVTSDHIQSDFVLPQESLDNIHLGLEPEDDHVHVTLSVEFYDTDAHSRSYRREVDLVGPASIFETVALTLSQELVGYALAELDALMTEWAIEEAMAEIEAEADAFDEQE